MKTISINLNHQIQTSSVSIPKQNTFETTNKKTLTVFLSPQIITLFLAMISLILIFANIAVLLLDYSTGYSSLIIHKVVKLFYLDIEQNIPSFFSMLLLLFASGLLAIITFLKQKKNDTYTLEWTILSLGFFYMAFDEVMAIHDRLVEPLQAFLGHQTLGIFYFAWVIPAIVLVSFLGLFFLKFLVNLPPKTRSLFLIAGAMFVGGSLGVELFQGAVAEKYGLENFSYYALVTIEESLEIFGVVLFISALLQYIADHCKELKLQFV